MTDRTNQTTVETVNINICSMNVQGLKKFENDPVFKNYCKAFDFIGMYETWQRDQDEFNNLLNGYTNFDCLRPLKRSANRGSGGVSVFVKDWLVNNNIVKRIFHEMSECVVLLLKGQYFENINDIVLVFTYIAPERSPIYSPENDNGIMILNEKIFDIKSNYPNADIIIAGDLNSRIKDFQDFIPEDELDFVFGETDYPSDSFQLKRKSKDCDVYNRFGLSLIDLCCEYDVHILNGRLFNDVDGNITCISNDGMSVVDYIIASSNLFESFSSFSVDEYDVSDHFPLKCSLRLALKRNMRKTTSNEQTHDWRKFKWKNSLKDDFLHKFNHNYSEFRDRVSLNEHEPSYYLQDFVKIFQASGNLMEVNFNKSKNNDTKNQTLWWDPACEEAKSLKYKALRKFRATNSPEDFATYKSQRNRFKSLCKLKKNDFQRKRRSALLDSKDNPKLFWQTIKGNSVSKTEKDNIIKCEDWLDYFEDLFSSPDTDLNGNAEDIFRNNINENNADNLDLPITEEEIRASIRNLNLNRSGGPDGLCIEMFKVTVDIIMPYLHDLFNYLYEHGIFPEDWCKSIISPIHKGGSVNKPENHRAVMLINCLCKIFMNILTIRLSNWAEENGVIDESQAGFRKQYSTVDNLFSLQALVQKYLCRPRGRFYCMFVDFKRAFDSIQHANLWLSLERKGITENSKFLKIFKSMYAQLKSCVKIQNGLTKYFECHIGTRQGCVSSPIIFSLFINDLVTYLRSQCDRGIFVSNQIQDLLALMFADDVASFSDSIFRLQQQINCIPRFCESVGMSLNLLKTKIIVFRNGGIVKDIEHWFYQGEHIDIVSFYKYLGVYFTPKLIWTKTKEVLAHQASKAVNRIFQYQRQFGFFQPKDIFKLFDSIVSPILCYGSEIWGYESSKTIEKIHTRFCKRFVGLHQNTADFLALSECGRYPISITYMSRCIKYWAKILQMPDHRYPKQCYAMLRSLSEAGKTTWATNVRMLLYKYGFGYVWESNTIGDVNAFVKVFKQRLKDCCLQEWQSDINESPKSKYYCKFKLILEL